MPIIVNHVHRVEKQEESGSEQAQQFAFQAEVQRLLDLVVHSLYTDNENVN